MLTKHLLTFLLLLSTITSRSYPAVNDQESYLSHWDLDLIQKDIKRIEDLKGYQLTLFVGSSLNTIKAKNVMPWYFKTDIIENFTDEIYSDMYGISSSGNKSILVVFSLKENKFRIRIGRDAKNSLSDNSAMILFQNVTNDLRALQYSTGVRKYIGSLADHFDHSSSGGSGSLVSVIIILAVVFCFVICFILIAAISKKNQSNPSYSHDLVADNYQTEYSDFNSKMARFKQNFATYQGPHFFHDYCLICFNDFSQFQLINQLPCGHRFHINCIQPIIAGNKSCPTCVNHWDKVNRNTFFQSIGNYHLDFYPGVRRNYDISWSPYDYAITSRVVVPSYNNVPVNSYGNGMRGVDYAAPVDNYGNAHRGVNNNSSGFSSAINFGANVMSSNNNAPVYEGNYTGNQYSNSNAGGATGTW